MSTGSRSSKYERRRASALLRNIRSVRKDLCGGKKPIVSVTYEHERILIKKTLTLHKMCVSTVTETVGFSPYKSLYLECYATMPMLADAHISSLGYLCYEFAT